MKKCVILIPVWKKMISLDELKSLIQCRMVLGTNADYDIKFICPERIDEQYYTRVWNGFDVEGSGFGGFERFPDRCFESRDTYSRLLCTKNFYRRFADYEYMLIYQLDAWVFKDSLSDWISEGYDYVGAPFCHLCRIWEGDCCGYVSDSFVGNGGLSLRKVSAFIDRLPFEDYDRTENMQSMPEDLYISMLRSLKKPTCDVAATFSVEVDARRLIEKYCPNDPPLGFHNLAAYDAELCGKLLNETFLGAEIIKNGIEGNHNG